MDEPWQFWLDVGGTFTDCIARSPDGHLSLRKVLSTAVTKGRVHVGFRGCLFVEPSEIFPENFWAGYNLRVFATGGRLIGEAEVTSSTLCSEGLRLGTRDIDWPPLPSTYELLSPEEAPLLAIRLFLGLRLDQPIPPCSVRLGTTRGTNALLTRRGAKTGFVTTRGFADILHIGYQNRPKLFELDIQKPLPLFSEVAEIDERMAAGGSVLLEPRDEQIRAELSRLKDAGCQSLAICLLNSYANPRHEEQVERVARELGFAEISTSSRIAPVMKIVPRGDTTVVDAYLNPVLRSYVESITEALPGSELRLMTSAGGLVSPAHFTGKDSLLSGPAGGYAGCARVAEAAGFAKAIGFDMGGTSTDVTRFDGQIELTYETVKAGVRVVTPALAIETVAAGGGSICRFDGVKLVVGPASAGADPGPACYGRGGSLTITDCNLILGRILSKHFPFPLDLSAARVRLAEVAADMEAADGSHQPSPPLTFSPSPLLALAAGFVRIANANMAQAIRSISIAKGYDPRGYILVAFGAAGPQHACAVADELGITKILLHPDAGVLSALGIGVAELVKHRVEGVYGILNQEKLSEATKIAARLVKQTIQDIREESSARPLRVSVNVDLRYANTQSGFSIPLTRLDAMRARFYEAHQQAFGYAESQRPLEITAVRAVAKIRSETTLPDSSHVDPITVSPIGDCLVHFAGQDQIISLFQREHLPPGATIPGPALIAEPLTTTLIDPGWQAILLSGRELLLTATPRGDSRQPSPPLPVSLSPPLPTPDPVLLELFNNHFTAIATQMGITLRNTAMSVNVKERLDFSCAIFTPAGDLVVNAPHIPVHLGAMSETVKAIIADNPDMQPGDVFVTNDPYRGGSHLPDVTVITPVFDSRDSQPLAPSPQPLFFTANRAHHAEIGGITPGSMPPFSKNLGEEGVLIRNFKLLAAGQPRFDELRAMLSAGPHPSRSVEKNLADITAQVAANQQGANDLARMIDRHSLVVVQAYMRHIQDAAERKLRTALAKLPPGRREFADHLDDGTPIRVAITIRGDSATIDFTGTGPVSTGNLNANPAIVTAAVMYVLRLLVGEDIPLNQGVLAPIEIILPECLLNPLPLSPSPPLPLSTNLPAIVGGNVETSQRIVDVLLGALGLAAASQGTMNNVLFGDDSFGYYETICGGSGATANAAGTDAVHTHMTNTRLTDPEVLEARYPVRLREFSVRRGSGGAGQHRGGNGVVRCLEFLKALTLSILSQRRGPYPPFGAAGGRPGALGRNQIQRVGRQIEQLPASTQIQALPGDVLTIETPGGGGWGATLPPNGKLLLPESSTA